MLVSAAALVLGTVVLLAPATPASANPTPAPTQQPADGTLEPTPTPTPSERVRKKRRRPRVQPSPIVIVVPPVLPPAGDNTAPAAPVPTPRPAPVPEPAPPQLVQVPAVDTAPSRPVARVTDRGVSPTHLHRQTDQRDDQATTPTGDGSGWLLLAFVLVPLSLFLGVALVTAMLRPRGRHETHGGSPLVGGINVSPTFYAPPPAREPERRQDDPPTEVLRPAQAPRQHETRPLPQWRDQNLAREDLEEARWWNISSPIDPEGREQR